MSYLQTKALKVNRNKSLEFRLKNCIYILFIQWTCDFWNNLVFEETAETLEWGTFTESELSFNYRLFSISKILFSQFFTELFKSCSNLR